MLHGWLSLLSVGLIAAFAEAVQPLTPDSWNELRNGEWMIKFYAPWCPACRTFNPTWSSFEQRCDQEKLNVRVAEVDVMQQPLLAGRMSIRKLPTVYHVKNGEYREYSGDRSIEGLMKFLSNSEYLKVEQLSSFSHPDSIPMTLYSYLYAASVYVKSFQDWFVSEKGYSMNAFYAVFLVGFVCTGLLLGFILVLASLLFEWAFARIFKSKRPSAGKPAPVSATATSDTSNGNDNGNGNEVSNEDEDSGETEEESESEEEEEEQEEQAEASADANGSDAAVRRRNMPRKD